VDEPPVRVVTIPVALMVPTAVLLLLHAPPGVTSASEVVPPAHTLVMPLIAAGVACTVTVALTEPHVPPTV